MLNDDVNQIERFLNIGFNEILQLLVLFIFAGSVMFGVSWELAMVGLLPMPIVLWGSLLYQRLISPRYRKVREAVGALSSRLENNIAGRVADMHFLLEKINLKIVAEFYHKIEHHLMSIRQSDKKKITKVYSHIHALSQCTKNIKKYKLEAINFIDTAGAAKFISEEKNVNLAAIGSELSS